MRADLDGLLGDAQRRALETHLAGCEACRAESQSLSSLTARLQTEFHARWNAQDGPSEHVLANIQSQSRRIIMSNRINVVFRTLAGAAVFAIFIWGINYVVAQIRANAAGEIRVTALPLQTESNLIAFTSEQNGNAEIYTMHADGSGVTNLTNNLANDYNPAWSPDGQKIAFISERTGNADIFIMNLDGNGLTQLTDDPGHDGFFSWSPDGTKIAYLFSKNSLFDISQLMVMNADGSDKTILAELASYTILGWSPDGQKIVYEITDVGDDKDTRVMVVSLDGTNTSDGPIFENDGGRRHSQMYWENSKQFITISLNKEQRTWGMWNLTRFYTNQEDYLKSAGSNPKLISSNSPIVAIFDGAYVIESQDSLSWFAYQGAPFPLSPWDFSQLCITPTDPLLQETTHTISPDQQHDFVRLQCPEGISYFFLMNSDGTEIQQLGAPMESPLQVTDATWSPDGNHVIATIANNESTDLYRFDIQKILNDPSTEPVQLTSDGVWKYGAVWQPVINPVVNNEVVEEKPVPETEKPPLFEGLIAFTVAAEDGNTEIFTMRPDGSGMTNLTNNPAYDANPFWSPDGKRIAFESDRNGFRQIFLMNADGSNITQLTDNQADHALTMNVDDKASPWSPDGRKLIFLESPVNEETWNLYIMDFNSGNKVQLANGKIFFDSVSWSPNGKYFGYALNTAADTNSLDMYVVEADGNNPINLQVLVPQDEDLDGQYYWSSNGQAVVFTASKNQNNSARQVFLYEYDLQTSALSQKTTFRPELIDWQEHLYFLWQGDQKGQVSFVWQRPDGTRHTFGWDTSCRQFDVTRSYQGNFAIGASCPDKQFRLYWANTDGSEVKQILDVSMETAISGLGHITWSPDDQYVTINIATSTQTSLYILNMEKALKDPSTQPWHVVLGGDVPSWQHVMENEVVEEKPTPEPLSFTLTIAETEALAGFDILEPSYIPAGYVLEGVSYDPQTGKVAMQYDSQSDHGRLYISQGFGKLTPDPNIQAYITPVAVGDTEGEYVQGAWIYDTPDVTTPKWDPRSDVYSLSWQQGEFALSINFLGGETIQPISVSELIAIAESMK